MDPTPEDECEPILNAAIDAGINLIGTGNTYPGEPVIGRILKANGRRHDVLISTMVDHVTGPAQLGPNERDLSRHNISRACERSLKNLQTDYIDLYLLHRPTTLDIPIDESLGALDIPIDESLGALDDLVRQGKVRYIGCSTFPAWMVMEAIMVSESKGWARFVAEQPPYNLLDRRIDNELVPMSQKWGVCLIPWAPMAIGTVTGRYRSDTDFPEESKAALDDRSYAPRVNRPGIEVGRAFTALAANAGLTGPQLAILWCKDQPGITAPLIGPRTLEQLQELLPVMEMELSYDLRDACDELVPPGNVVTDFHNTADWMKMTVAN